MLEFEEDLAPWMSPLEDMLPSRADYGLGVKANDRLLVEQYMKGVVIGCDTFTHNGQHTLIGVNEKLFLNPHRLPSVAAASPQIVGNSKPSKPMCLPCSMQLTLIAEPPTLN